MFIREGLRSSPFMFRNLNMDLITQLAKFARIETDRLILRPQKLEDVDDQFEYASRPENLTFVFPPVSSKTELEWSIANHHMKNPLGKWAIELKTGHKMIGTIDFVELKENDMTAEIGYCLNMDYWGKGYATEALQSLTQHSFQDFGLREVVLNADTENLASIAVIEKAGYRFIKNYKAANKYSGKIRQFAQYRLRKAEYYEQT